MRRSIKYILIVLVTGLLMLFVADYFLQIGFRKSKDDVIGKLNEIISDTTYYDILCFGSSRGLAHINPSIIENETGFKTYNAGLNGGTFVDFNALFKVYINKHPLPKMIVIHIDEFTFETESIKELPRYLPYISNDLLYENLADYDNTFIAVKYFPFLRVTFYSDLLKWISIKSWLKIDAREEYKMVNGYRVNESHWNVLLQEKLPGRYKMINETQITDEADRQGEELFKDILESCRINNIKIILISSPLIGGNNYLKYDHTCEKIETISKGYDVSYFWNHHEQWDPEEYYYDFTHMNNKGADRFSLMLAEIINKK